MRGKTIGLLGLTFKPNTDDMRDAPSLAIVPRCRTPARRCAPMIPKGMDEAPNAAAGRRLTARTPMMRMEGADALAILTEWDEFRALDLERIKGLMVQPVLVDLRNIYEPSEVARKGFRYVDVGRASVRMANPIDQFLKREPALSTAQDRDVRISREQSADSALNSAT